MESCGPLAIEEQLSFKNLFESLLRAAKDLEETLGSELMGLVLFGSWARGEASKDSDVDIFVVLKSLKGMEARSTIYRVIARHVGRALTLVDMRADEVFGEKVELTPLLLNILSDGIIIYDGTGRLSALMEKTRRLMDEAKLVRYRTPDGKYGWKKLGDGPLTKVEL